MNVFLAAAAWYAVLSILTFFTYAIDKIAAIRGMRRIPEDTLHLLALLGGWPGALLAQFLVRHKSVKPSFQRVFWLTLLANCLTLTAIVAALRA